MYKTIAIREKTDDRLDEICSNLHYAKMALLELLINELYVLVKPINQATIEFSGSQADGILKILVRDQNQVVVGQFDQSILTSNAETDKKIKALVEKQIDEKRGKK